MILHCKTAIQAELCVAKCLKCGAVCSAIQSNSHPELVNTIQSFKCAAVFSKQEVHDIQ